MKNRRALLVLAIFIALITSLSANAATSSPRHLTCTVQGNGGLEAPNIYIILDQMNDTVTYNTKGARTKHVVGAVFGADEIVWAESKGGLFSMATINKADLSFTEVLKMDGTIGRDVRKGFCEEK
jgi:phosphoserine aminotransferase